MSMAARPRYADPKLRGDREIVLAAVRSDARAYAHISLSIHIYIYIHT